MDFNLASYHYPHLSYNLCHRHLCVILFFLLRLKCKGEYKIHATLLSSRVRENNLVGTSTLPTGKFLYAQKTDNFKKNCICQCDSTLFSQQKRCYMTRWDNYVGEISCSGSSAHLCHCPPKNTNSINTNTNTNTTTDTNTKISNMTLKYLCGKGSLLRILFSRT